MGVKPKHLVNKMKQSYSILVYLFLYIISYNTVSSIKCYQCSSTEDQRKPTGIWSKDQFTQNRFEDNCGVYWPFQTERNIPVECNSDESHTPGTFCVKILKQGPRGFIWDGRWRQVFRRCASVSDTGVTGVCNWGVLGGVLLQRGQLQYCSRSADVCSHHHHCLRSNLQSAVVNHSYSDLFQTFSLIFQTSQH